MSIRSRRSTRFAATLVLALGVCLAIATPALGYVLELEPARPSDESGNASLPYPAATEIDGPGVSRAIWGYLTMSERFDAYSFTVSEHVASELTVLVPDEARTRPFRPVATVIAEDRVVAVIRDPGEPAMEREGYFDTFAGASFLVGGSQLIEFDPGVRYVVTVSAGTGAARLGSYVVVMSGTEEAGLSDLLDVGRAHLGLYGQSPFRWDVFALWLTVLAVIVVLVFARRRRAAHPRAAPRDIFGL